MIRLHTLSDWEWRAMRYPFSVVRGDSSWTVSIVELGITVTAEDLTAAINTAELARIRMRNPITPMEVRAPGTGSGQLPGRVS